MIHVKAKLIGSGLCPAAGEKNVRFDRKRSFGVGSTSATLHFVGWVEPILGYVGFRFTLPNLQFANSIVQSETQQLPILKPARNFYKVVSYKRGLRLIKQPV
jgi:hypothetical protein